MVNGMIRGVESEAEVRGQHSNDDRIWEILELGPHEAEA